MNKENETKIIYGGSTQSHIVVKTKNNSSLPDFLLDE